MKEKLIINIHSFIDVITNSSTELFVFESEKTIYELRNLISLQEKECPSEYGYKVSVCEENVEEYLKDEYNIYESENKIEIPEFCSVCNSIIQFDGIRLFCPNEECDGQNEKNLIKNLSNIK